MKGVLKRSPCQQLPLRLLLLVPRFASFHTRLGLFRSSAFSSLSFSQSLSLSLSLSLLGFDGDGDNDQLQDCNDANGEKFLLKTQPSKSIMGVLMAYIPIG